MNDQKLPGNRMLRAKENASALNISRALAYRLMQTGKILTVLINWFVKVRLYDLEEFIRHIMTVEMVLLWTQIQ